MRFFRGAEDLHSSFVVDNHAETQLLSGKAGQFWQSLDDISFIGKDKALMGYIDFSSKHCQIPRFITVRVTGFSERNRRFLRPTCVVIEIAAMDGYSYWVRSIWLLITGACPMNRSKIWEKWHRSSLQRRHAPVCRFVRFVDFSKIAKITVNFYEIEISLVRCSEMCV